MCVASLSPPSYAAAPVSIYPRSAARRTRSGCRYHRQWIDDVGRELARAGSNRRRHIATGICARQRSTRGRRDVERRGRVQAEGRSSPGSQGGRHEDNAAQDAEGRARGEAQQGRRGEQAVQQPAEDDNDQRCPGQGERRFSAGGRATLPREAHADARRTAGALFASHYHSTAQKVSRTSAPRWWTSLHRVTR